MIPVRYRVNRRGVVNNVSGRIYYKVSSEGVGGKCRKVVMVRGAVGNKVYESTNGTRHHQTE